MPIIECPSCNEILEIEPPDRLHSALISAKPIPKSFHRKIIQERVRCKNQDCRKTIIVYWYAPLEYFCGIQ